MPRRKPSQGEERENDRNAVFLNIPYDEQFTQLFLAYVVGIRGYGLIPRATIEIPGGARRLDRIASLIRSCAYSIHDLSRVELDPAPPPTPRFNMPFELGLAVAFHWSRSAKHTWFVLETEKWRIQKLLSDLNGTDVYIHGGTPDGVFRELAKDWPIKLSDHNLAPVCCFRNIAEVDILIFHSFQCCNLPT